MAALLLTAAIAAGAEAVVAQTAIRRPVPVAVPARPGANATPKVPRPEHFVSGTIVKMAGRLLLVQLRDRRLLRVDASSPLATGRYSAPLFVGKVVIVEGSYARDGTLLATTVTRLSRIDRTTPLDR
jgi:hypothetical protein